MGEMKFVPNVNQYTFAAVIAFNIIAQHKILMCIPAGQGKSRVILTIPLLVDKTRFNSFLILYTHQSLLSRDMQYLEHLKSFLKHSCDVQFRVLVENEPVIGDNKTLVIVDEADQVFLDWKAEIKARYVVGLSATPMSAREGVEATYMKAHLRFSIYDSGIAADVTDTTHVPVVTSIKHFAESSKKGAKLIYACDEKVKDEVAREFAANIV